MSVIREDRMDDAISILTLNRPEQLNALNLDMRRQLVDALAELDGDDRIRAIVVTGNEQAFAAGADVGLLAEAGPADLHKLGLARLWAKISETRKPLIAAVNGYAFGAGFELALLCDIIIGGPGTKIALPEIKLGIMPGAGGTQRLLRLVGHHRAMGMLLSGEPINGPMARDWGVLTDYVSDDVDVLPRAIERAVAVARMAPLAVEMIKSAAVCGADLPLASALLIEQRNMQILFDTPEQKQLMRAFLEKRSRRTPKSE